MNTKPITAIENAEEKAEENFIFGIGKICGIENAIAQISPSQTQSGNRDSRNCRSVQCKRLNKQALNRERQRQREM